MTECCGSQTRLIYSCSGAADVGEIADRVTRRLRNDGYAKMACLAAVGAELSGYVQSARGADVAITIDGCAHACARKSLERIGVKPVSYILTKMGLVKGETPISEAIIAGLAGEIKDAKYRPIDSQTGECS